MKKLTPTLIGLLIFVVVATFIPFAGVPVAKAATINVPGDYATIQAAITAASAGDTITVAAGTYAETITIDKSLTLNGAQHGIDARTRSGNESIIDGTGLQTAVYLTGNDVTLDGFTIAYTGVGDWTTGTYGILAATSSGGVIKNNIIDGRFYFGVITSGIIQHYHFSYNVVEPAGTSVYIDGADDLTFDHNLFKGGVLLTGGNTYSRVQNVVFDSNETTAQTNDDIYAFGFAVWDAVQNVEFVHNDIHGNRRGIQVAHSQIGWPHPINLTIHDNKIYDNNPIGVYTPYGIENVRVDENTGQLFHDDPDITTVTATNNWWGAASGPYHATLNPGGTGNAVSDNVNFNPWYVDAAMTRLSNYVEPSGGGAAPAPTPETYGWTDTTLISNPSVIQDTPVRKKAKITLDSAAIASLGGVKVQFFVDGKLKKIDKKAPFNYNLKVKSGTHTLTIKIFDSKGNLLAQIENTYTK